MSRPAAVRAALSRDGFCILPPDAGLADWIASVTPAVRRAAAAPENGQWRRCGGTWFAGVNCLDNDAAGRIGGQGPALPRGVRDLLRELFGPLALDRGQISAVYPGYPRQEGESDAAFGFRQRRDAAHVDGLLRRGDPPRRHAGEFHAYILGLPVTDCGSGASPLVGWAGSHRIMGRMLRDRLGPLPPDRWGTVDLTEAYAEARRVAFRTCRRVVLHAPPGGATLLHRHLLHGVTPWQQGAAAPPEGRIIIYFRPELTNRADWLDD